MKSYLFCPGIHLVDTASAKTQSGGDDTAMELYHRQNMMTAGADSLFLVRNKNKTKQIKTEAKSSFWLQKFQTVKFIKTSLQMMFTIYLLNIRVLILQC